MSLPQQQHQQHGPVFRAVCAAFVMLALLAVHRSLLPGTSPADETSLWLVSAPSLAELPCSSTTHVSTDAISARSQTLLAHAKDSAWLVRKCSGGHAYASRAVQSCPTVSSVAFLQLLLRTCMMRLTILRTSWHLWMKKVRFCMCASSLCMCLHAIHSLVCTYQAAQRARTHTHTHRHTCMVSDSAVAPRFRRYRPCVLCW